MELTLAKRTAVDAVDGLTHHVEQATLDCLRGRHRDACAGRAQTAMPRLNPSVASIEMARTVSSSMSFGFRESDCLQRAQPRGRRGS